MDDLISRQAAIDAIRHIEEVYVNNLPPMIDKAFVQTELMMLPSAEPERKQGKWKMNSDYPDMLICSECDGHFDCWHWEIGQMHYCPNCGADMRGEQWQMESS